MKTEAVKPNPHPMPSKNDRSKEGKIKISVRLTPKIHGLACQRAKYLNVYLMDWVEKLVMEALKKPAA